MIAPKKRQRPVALFDLDGTLMDTPRAIAAQLVVAVEHVTGRAPSFETAHALIGRPLPEICALLSGFPESSEVDAQIVERYRYLYRQNVVPSAKDLLFPGVAVGLARLRAAGVEMAVVTSKQFDSAKLILDTAGITGYFTTVIGVDDTKMPKPHPDPALLALERLGADESNAVFIGDTTTDLQMAHAVPMRSIAVTYGVGSESQLRHDSPTVTAKDFGAAVSHVLELSNLESELAK